MIAQIMFTNTNKPKIINSGLEKFIAHSLYYTGSDMQ